MEYSCNTYKHGRGQIYTTSDGFKYSRIRTYKNVMFLRCVLHRNSTRCHGTAKLKEFSNEIEPNHPHNHPISEYHTELYELKSKCKLATKTSQGRLTKVFRECTRSEPAASLLSYKNLETSMYRSRREIDPKIPKSAAMFCDQIMFTRYERYYKGAVQVGEDIGVVFFSERMNEFLTGVEEIQFDGTFFTVPIQFYQLWTVFACIRGHVIPCIHCLLTGKQETLYTEILRKIRELIPQLQPIRGMSDWEKAPRNSVNLYLREFIYRDAFFTTLKIFGESYRNYALQIFTIVMENLGN